MTPPNPTTELLTPRNRLLRTLRGESPAGFAFDFDPTPPVRAALEQGGYPVPGDVERLWVTPVQAEQAWERAYAAAGIVLPQPCEVFYTGIVQRIPSAESVGAASHLRELFHPLAGLDDVETVRQLPWPDFTDPVHYQNLRADVAAIHARGHAAYGNMECSLFEHTWYLRGMEDVFVELMEDDADSVTHWLLDYFTERSIQVTLAYAEAGVDVIGLGDDIGTQRGMLLSPDLWRAQIKPRLARIIRVLRSAFPDRPPWIRYHSDGDIRDVIPDLIEIGVDILNPLQSECMPVEEVIRAYGDRLAFWGMIGTQSTLPFGNPDEVWRNAEQLVRLAREGFRLVIAPTHVVEPDVPLENILALTETLGTSSHV